MAHRRVPRPISASMARQMGHSRRGASSSNIHNRGSRGGGGGAKLSLGSQRYLHSSSSSNTFQYVEFTEPVVSRHSSAQKKPSTRQIGVMRGSTRRNKKRDAIFRAQGQMSRSAPRQHQRTGRIRPSTASSNSRRSVGNLKGVRPATARARQARK